jgi:hypothetical protein
MTGLMSARNVGGEVDAFCSSCKLILGHTILAMVGEKIARVRCNTCSGEHAFRATPPGVGAPRRTKTASSVSSPRARAEAAVRGHALDELLEGRDVSGARSYAPHETFAQGEVMRHPSFGVGLVMEIRGDRLDVMFGAGLRTLALRRASQTLVKRLDHRAAPASETDAESEAETDVESEIEPSAPIEGSNQD